MKQLGVAVAAAAVATLVAVVGARRARRKRRRRYLRSLPFPEPWRKALEENLPVYAAIPEHLKEELHGLIRIFMDEKRFEGCGGLEVTEAMRVTIAAQACMLLLNRRTRIYPTLYTILVYPEAYRAPTFTRIGGQLAETESVRVGESWTGGSVVLVWDDVRGSAADFHDGHNVVLHEFAHQIDQEDGRADGAPILAQRSHYVTWARVLGREYTRLQASVARQHLSVLDGYGATAPAEFFAVATEAFFEKPAQLKEKHPDLYGELSRYYRLDPEAWHDALKRKGAGT